VHEFWELVGRNLEIIAYVLGGILVAIEIEGGGNLEFSDFLNGFLMYLILHVIRFIVILVHFPILRLLG